ncbi:hypothetical protein AX15_004040 [Amanita polypyramis BW_CC]|nr:hypothetical protein AX15_004040 [Amanita polypyramis BW_CC]
MTRHHLPPAHNLPQQQLRSDYDDDDDDDETSATSVLSLSLTAPATSITSYDRSMRSASPTQSVVSMTESLREQIFRQEFGRGLNNYSEVYCLPADDDEWDRLEKQHSFMAELIGKYPPPLREIMRDEGPGEEIKRCLDLGCGNGSWIMGLACDFPHCEAVAVDLVPMQSLLMPPNLRSEIDDINLGLEHFYGDFNVVHAWLISSGIKDYERLIDQISRVLRPGGLIDVMEWDFSVYDVNKRIVNLSTDQWGPPWVPRFTAFVQSAIRKRGGDVVGPLKMELFVEAHPSFEQVVHRDFWVPAYHWSKGESTMLENTPLTKENVFEFVKSAAPLLLSDGLQPELLALLQENVRRELVDPPIPLWVKMKHVYALKRR